MKTENGRGTWYVYMLSCKDGSLYTGITKDLERRIEEHGQGSASRYTRSRRPVRLIHRELCEDRSDALKKEAAVKRMTKAKKKEYLRIHAKGSR